MKHFWNKLKYFLLTFVLYFVFGILIGGVKSDMVWEMYTLGLFIVFPVYLLWIIFSEIKYAIKSKKHATVAKNVPTSPDINHSSEVKHPSENSSKNSAPLSSTADTKPKSQSNVQKDTTKEEPLTLDDLGIKVTFKPINKAHISRRTNSNVTIHHLRRKLYNFVVVDTETTGLEKDAKIIQLSAIRYEHDKPVESFNKYINPGTLPLPSKITAITGITTEQLQNAPRIDEILNDFMTFVGTLPWIGHNINSFDIPRLINNGFPISDVSTIDTLRLAKKKLHMNKYGLEELKYYYGIQNKSHNALEDCKTNALVYQRLRDDDLIPVQADYSNVPQTLTGLNFAISGAFSGYSKKDVEELIKSHGGKVKSTVTHDTDYLVDGTQISDRLTDGVHSAKELKARDYGTKVVSLSELIKMIGE